MTQISYLGVDWILILLFRKLKVYKSSVMDFKKSEKI